MRRVGVTFLVSTLLLASHSFAQEIVSFAMVFPLMAAKVSSNYGKRVHPIYRSVRHHNGVDFKAPSGSHVRAVAAGKVVFSGTYKGYGKLVTIEHTEGYVSLYGHLSERLVNIGEKVPAGHLIGRVGSTGLSTGPHLHFEWRRKGTPINPMEVFPQLRAPATG